MAGTYQYFVEQRYGDRGQVSCRILSRDEALSLGYYDNYNKELEKCDLYVDGCVSLHAAHRLIAECKRA